MEDVSQRKQREEHEFVMNEYKEGSDEHHGFGTLMIHSLVETIEYSLGTISNTASYLRLWALSLAHSRLSDVFSTPLGMAVKSSPDSWVSYILVFIGYYTFFGMIFALVLAMDQMECHLHTVRLVWVEFMNKFYSSENGDKWNAYNLNQTITAHDDTNPEGA